MITEDGERWKSSPGKFIMEKKDGKDGSAHRER